ncbi:MAG: hypothetical protein V1833_04845 [Elusimicrobiota bacterium]
MQKIIMAHMSSKAQVTVPKEARQILGIGQCNIPIGFIVEPETHTVKLTRVNVTSADEDFTEEEYKKLRKLAKKPGGKIFTTAAAVIKYHKKLTKS